MAYLMTKDADWVRQAFLLPPGEIDRQDLIRRTYSEVSNKFTDTTLGGNYVMNPPPQFTRYADLKQNRTVKNSKGMGRYYSEAIDDHNQIINMRFGLPSYNSLAQFFLNFYDSDLGHLVSTGRNSGLIFNFGKIIGLCFGWPLRITILTGRAVRFMLNMPSSKYYYLKPAMPLYWNAVNGMVNELAQNMGLIAPLVQTKYDQSKMAEFSNQSLSDKERAALNKLLPDIFRGDGGIDIYAVATRAQRLAARWDDMLVDAMEKANSIPDLKARFEELQGRSPSLERNRALQEYLKDYWDTDAAKDNRTGDAKTDSTGILETIGSWFSDNGGDFLAAEERDGSQFVSFRVDSTGPASASFSSSTRESDIASTINSTSSTNRNARFSIADGNVGDGILASTIESVIGAAKTLVNGIASGVGLEGLGALAGNAFVDIPKHWDSSSANLPSMSYTIKLRAPYGNDMSRFISLYVPMAMLLAGALPLATGNASYRSPFLVEIYSRGRAQCRMGIITDLSMQWGTGNVGFNKDKKPLGIDITFTVQDLSSIMYMPVSPGFSPGDVLDGAFEAKLFAEDSTYHDFLSVLSSMPLNSQIYQIPKFMRNLTTAVADFKSWASISHAANWAAGTPPGRLFSTILKGTDRL